MECSGPDGAGSKRSGPMGPDTAHICAARAPNGAASSPTTTREAGNAIPAGSTTTKEVHRKGSHF